MDKTSAEWMESLCEIVDEEMFSSFMLLKETDPEGMRRNAFFRGVVGESRDRCL